jgi:site-specific recombinase XerD
MNDSRLLESRLQGYLRNFFDEYLSAHRGLSPNTIRAYRDSWVLLLRYGVEQRCMGEAGTWRLGVVDRDLVLSYLRDLENRRGVSISTRNLRLAAVHAFFHYLAGCAPELEQHCHPILAIPSKKARKALIGYLETEELRAVLESVLLDCSRAYRDLTLLVFAYNTAARVHEVARARCTDIVIPTGVCPYIRIRGKGGKDREIPLWEGTRKLLEGYQQSYRPQARDTSLFLSVRGTPLTRFQVGRIITHYIRKATINCPSMARKRLVAHSLRHTTAVHLLQAGVELNVIRSWLGHASIDSLQCYLDLNLTAKKEILETLVTPVFTNLLLHRAAPEAHEDIDLLDWLGKL